MKRPIALLITIFSLNASAQVFNETPREVKRNNSSSLPQRASNTSVSGQVKIKPEIPLASADSKGFYTAAQNKNYEMMDFYLSRGADVNCQNCGFDGRTALLNNVFNFGASDPKLVKYLMDHGADANISDPQKMTPLMAAMMPNNLYYNSPNLAEIVGLLIGAGVNLEAVDSEGRTAINYIEDTSTSRRLAMLIKAGANINNQPHKDGITLLMRAAKNCAEQEYLEMLIKAGADINLKSNEGKRAIDYALERATNLNSPQCNKAFKLLSNLPAQSSGKIRGINN